jgi:broad specificity phosphatase PhoE
MERLRARLGLDPKAFRSDDRLQELAFGDWEGLTWREVRARDPKGATARDRDKWAFVPPSGESYAMLRERVAPVLETITRDTVMVAHGGVARALLVHLTGLAHAEAPHLDIWQGRVLVIEANRSRWV